MHVVVCVRSETRSPDLVRLCSALSDLVYLREMPECFSALLF